MLGLNLEQTDQVHHIAKLALFAMCARGVASSEFHSSPEVEQIQITVTRPSGSEEADIDMQFLNSLRLPLGGHVAVKNQRDCKFTLHWPKTGVIRGFDDHDVFSEYVSTVVAYGALVKWRDSHHAVAVMPEVEQ